MAAGEVRDGDPVTPVAPVTSPLPLLPAPAVAVADGDEGQAA